MMTMRDEQYSGENIVLQLREHVVDVAGICHGTR